VNACLTRPLIRFFSLGALLGALVLSTSACKSIKIKTESIKELSGLFDNDHSNYMARLKSVVVDKTTLKDLEIMGITNGVKNVQFWEGYQAAVHLPDGDSAITVMVNPNTVLDDIAKFRNLVLIRIPYKRITTKSKRIYFSNNFKEVKGIDATFTFLVNNGTVVYTALVDRSVDTLSTSHSFGKGFTEIASELGSIGGSANKIAP